MSLKHAGRTALNALVAAPAKKMRPRARTEFPFGLFRVRHGGAEKKFNRTGGTAGKTLAGGLALREAATEDSIPPHRILRRRAQGEATKPAARIAGLKSASMTISSTPFTAD